VVLARAREVALAALEEQPHQAGERKPPPQTLVSQHSAAEQAPALQRGLASTALAAAPDLVLVDLGLLQAQVSAVLEEQQSHQHQPLKRLRQLQHPLRQPSGPRQLLLVCPLEEDEQAC